MSKQQSEIDPKFLDWFEEIKPALVRDPRAAAEGRARFLALADSMLEQRNARRAPLVFQLNWQTRFAAKALVSVLVVAGILSGGGVTVYAAQDDLPNQALYPVKLVTEDVRLGVNTNPQAKFDLLMDLTQRRVDEMAALEQQGEEIPARVIERLSRQNRQALQIAASMDDNQMNAALRRFRTKLETQAEVVDQLAEQAPPDSAPALVQTQSMLQERLSLVETGLEDPQDFREAVQEDQANSPAPAPQPDVAADVTATLQPTPVPTATPQDLLLHPSTPDKGVGEDDPGQAVDDPGSVATPSPTATPSLVDTPGNDSKGPTKTHKPKPGEIEPTSTDVEPTGTPPVETQEPQPTDVVPTDTPVPVPTETESASTQVSTPANEVVESDQIPASENHGPRSPQKPHPEEGDGDRGGGGRGGYHK